MLARSLVLVAACATAVALALVEVASASPAGAAFPVTITTPSGKVIVPKLPRRIVSLSPTATETLFAIGAGKQVIAVDDQSDHPKSAPRTKLSGFTPNVEAIAGYRPDLVVIAFDPKGLAGALGRLGIPVVVHDAPRGFTGAYQQIRQLGLVTGQLDGATKLIARMKKQIGLLVKRSKDKSSGLSVFHELSPDLYSASSASFAGKVYDLLGLANIADKADPSRSGYPQLSAEYVVAASPDLIVLADGVCCGQRPSTVASRPGWDRVNAVKSGSILRIDDSLASRWGPRLVDFFRGVATAIARLRT